jgi:hypothetical protein
MSTFSRYKLCLVTQYIALLFELHYIEGRIEKGTFAVLGNREHRIHLLLEEVEAAYELP